MPNAMPCVNCVPHKVGEDRAGVVQAAGQGDIQVRFFKVELADHPDGQPPEFAAGPADGRLSRRVARGRRPKNKRRVRGRETITAQRQPFQQILYIGRAGQADERVAQASWGAAHRPRHGHRLNSPGDQLAPAAVLAKERAAARHSALPPLAIAAAAVGARPGNYHHAPSFRRSGQQADDGVVDKLARASSPNDAVA